jgi:hypothetical protein
MIDLDITLWTVPSDTIQVTKCNFLLIFVSKAGKTLIHF